MMKEMSELHEEDACDDNLIAIETSNQIHTRVQIRAAENAANLHILEPANVDNHTNLPIHVRNADSATNETGDKATLLSSILPPRATSGDNVAHTCPYIQHDKAASIYTQTLLITVNTRSQ